MYIVDGTGERKRERGGGGVEGWERQTIIPVLVCRQCRLKVCASRHCMPLDCCSGESLTDMANILGDKEHTINDTV